MSSVYLQDVHTEFHKKENEEDEGGGGQCLQHRHVNIKTGGMDKLVHRHIQIINQSCKRKT
jgi:hypothetical protein